ncbi:MAG: hypothetical protein RLY20_1145 [Verrucomicrobiota bacterium]|jgi:hypothetical protein
MIALASDCIVLRRPNGEAEPASASQIAIEVVTEGESPFNEEFVKEASAAVLHYFKQEQGRDSVTLGEFAEALEKVLQGFKPSDAESTTDARVLEFDLLKLAANAGAAFELDFFPRLRDEMRANLQKAPQMLRFRGLRNCVMQLTGARRWTARCQDLQEQILAFLRNCLTASPHPDSCTLVVE